VIEFTDLEIDPGLGLRLSASAAGLRAIEFQPYGSREMVRNDASKVLLEAARQLKAYFERKLKEFDLPLDPQGTGFQLRVWRALGAIPYGQTRSYREVAQSIGSPNAVRAVGAANGSNPIPIVVPCHRVIGANGKLVGYGGGLPLKRRLLELESAGEVSLF